MLFGLSIEKILVRLFIAVCILPFHEFAHAYTAHKLGDDTARLSGRMTINPLAHIDPFGVLMMLLVGVGYAKAVPVNVRNFKLRKRKLYMAIVSLMGPVSNIIMAFVLMLIFNAIFYLGDPSDNILTTVCALIFYAAQINVSLAVFNMIPIPPLDGSRILSLILPNKYYFKIMQYERYLILIVLALAFLGVFSGPLEGLSFSIINFMNRITSLPFRMLVQ